MSHHISLDTSPWESCMDCSHNLPLLTITSTSFQPFQRLVLPISIEILRSDTCEAQLLARNLQTAMKSKASIPNRKPHQICIFFLKVVLYINKAHQIKSSSASKSSLSSSLIPPIPLLAVMLPPTEKPAYPYYYSSQFFSNLYLRNPPTPENPFKN